MLTLVQTLRDIKGDLIVENNLFISFLKSYFFNPSFRLLLNHRIGKYFYFKKNPFFRIVGIYYKNKMILKRNCDISYYAVLGKKLKFPHPLGVVIGDRVIIEDSVMIFQQVTFGSHGKRGIKQREYPLIKSGVKVFAGAKIIGGITVGENTIIGANAVVNVNVPSDCIAVGIPCKIIQK